MGAGKSNYRKEINLSVHTGQLKYSFDIVAES